MKKKVAEAELKQFISRELPVNTNGKIDKKALPEPNLEAGLISYIAPQNDTEAKLVAIWQDILGLKQIGTTDNFFSIGGNSLKITLLAVKLQKTFNLKIPIAELFQLPTIKGLAVRIAGEAGKTFSEIKVMPKQAYYAVSSVEKRLFALDKIPEIGKAYHINFAERRTSRRTA